MKSTGIVRRVDELGRIVVPKEIRRTLGIAEGDPVEIYTDGEYIIIEKYRPFCHFCGNEETFEFKGKNICKKCIKALSKKL